MNKSVQILIQENIRQASDACQIIMLHKSSPRENLTQQRVFC